MTANRKQYRHIERIWNGQKPADWMFSIFHNTRQGHVIDATQRGFASFEEAQEACMAIEKANGWTKVQDF